MKSFALIGVTLVRSKHWCNPTKLPLLLCWLPFRKADDSYLLRYQGVAVDDYGFGLDVLS